MCYLSLYHLLDKIKFKFEKEVNIYKSFTGMTVWQNSNNLSLRIFKLTQGSPRSEDYGLTS